MTRLKENFVELNRSFRQINRSVFGVGQVIEAEGDEVTVRWLVHTQRDLRDEAQRVERIPTCYMRLVKPGRAALFQALLSASTKGRIQRNAIPYEWAVVAAEARQFLAEQGYTGRRLHSAAFKMANEFFHDMGWPPLAIESLYPELLRAA